MQTPRTSDISQTYSTIECLGYPVFSDRLERIGLEEKMIINTINQYSYCIAEKDERFKEALMNSDILLPDGIGIVAASRFLNGNKIKKIAGADIHRFLLEKLNRESGSCFYLGSSKKTLKKIKKRIQKEYPNIRVGKYSPPFKPSFSRKTSDKMVRKVNEFRPDVLFMGMTAPKQEKWAFAHKRKLEVRLICSIGAVFDFYAGTVKRPGKVWINSGMEWLGRLVKEPKRMRERYLYYGAIFTYNLTLRKYRSFFSRNEVENLPPVEEQLAERHVKS